MQQQRAKQKCRKWVPEDSVKLPDNREWRQDLLLLLLLTVEAEHYVHGQCHMLCAGRCVQYCQYHWDLDPCSINIQQQQFNDISHDRQ